jgi:DNA-binding SARP family transcriptional activator
MEDACRPKPLVAAKVRAPRIHALERPRLTALLGRAWGVPLTLLVAPSGSGKTTALCQFVEAAKKAGRPVAWCQVEESDADERELLRHLDAAFAQCEGTESSGWSTVEATAATFESWSGNERALVIDDLHLLEGSAAEKALERLTGYLPPSVHLVVAGRRPPTFNLPRLRLQGQLNEIGPDALRFRSWEADDLFRRHFAEPLPHDELAELLRRTDGWAAGLQMFRLATTGRSATQRQEVLSNLSGRIVEVREYLDRNLLEGLDEELLRFLVRSSVLGRVTASWCGALLDDGHSDRLLYEVERRHGFLAPDKETATLRYSDVLRERLEGLLVQEVGESAARDFHRRAARILEAGQALPEALRSYCLAEDWDAAENLLNHGGERIFDGLSATVKLPSRLPGLNAWALLATARRELAAGSWAAATESYRRAEGSFRHASAADTCRRERQAIESWLEPAQPHPTDWIGELRHALGSIGTEVRRPEPSSEPTDVLVAGVASIASGRFSLGRHLLDSVVTSGRASPVVAGYARLLSHLTKLLLGEGDPHLATEAADAVDAVERAAPPWLSGLIVALAPGSATQASIELQAAGVAAQETGNPWMTASLIFIDGILRLTRGSADQSRALLDNAGRQFETLGAVTVAAWAQALCSLALGLTDRQAGHDAAAAAAQSAEAHRCPGALALSLRIMHAITPESSVEARAVRLEAEGVVGLGAFVDRTVGLTGPSPRRPLAPGEDEPLEIDVKCFGGFSLSINGRSVDSLQVRPRAQSVLHILALHAGQVVHRDHFLACLWPDDLNVGLRNLQVALSSLRRLLEPVSGRGRSTAIRRKGDCYFLATTRQRADITVFEDACRTGHRGLRSGAYDEALVHLRRAVDLYRGDLLPEAGTAEWVLEPRDRYRLMAVRAAEDLARSALAQGDSLAAVDACRRGLELDRYSDGLWRSLIECYERADDQLSATRTRKEYDKALSELDLVSYGVR